MKTCPVRGIPIVKKNYNDMVNIFSYDADQKLFNDVFVISKNAEFYLEHHSNKEKIISLIRQSQIESEEKGIPCVFLLNREEDTAKDFKNSFFLEDFHRYSFGHSQKEKLLLVELSKDCYSTLPFGNRMFDHRAMYRLCIFDDKEMSVWFNALNENGLIEIQGSYIGNTPFNTSSIITPRGWEVLDQLNNGSNSNLVFIAMSFGLNDRTEVQKAIENGCRASGFKAITVDMVEHQDGISDKIVSLINQSRFVVADFTENNLGVYYEAGYAKGLGKEVIFTVNKKHVDDLHFDTQHINHILWSDYEELEKSITNRIGAIINSL